MGLRVYCENCSYFKKIYYPIKYIETEAYLNNSIHRSSENECDFATIEVVEIRNTPSKIIKTISYLIHSNENLNKDNNCIHYQQKFTWWKKITKLFVWGRS